MSFYDNIDDDAAGVEDRMASGGQIAPGFYRAKLVGAAEVESKSKGTPGMELTFEVMGGVFDGKEVSDTLWNTDKQFSQDRIKLAMVRLGLRRLNPQTNKLEKVEGKNDFLDCRETEIVIEIVHEPDQHDKAKFWPRIAPNGFHDPNDSKIKDIMAKGGKPRAGGKGDDKGGGTAGSGAKSPPPPPPPSATGTAKKRDVSRL